LYLSDNGATERAVSPAEELLPVSDLADIQGVPLQRRFRFRVSERRIKTSKAGDLLENQNHCAECDELLGAAQRATERHIAAIGRHQIATIRREADLICALAVVVREAQGERERAMAAYRHHVGMHRAEQAGMSA
jgi:hypothetical protein